MASKKEAAKTTRIESLPLSEIAMLETLNVRASVDEATAKRYAGLIEDGVEFDPIDVFVIKTMVKNTKTDEEEEQFVTAMVGGRHRYRAHQMLDRRKIPCTIYEGYSYTEALEHAMRGNRGHGLPMSRVDKIRSVRLALGDSTMRTWSDKKIAGCIGVSPTFVGTIRKSGKAQRERPEPKPKAPAKRRGAEPEADATDLQMGESTIEGRIGQVTAWLRGDLMDLESLAANVRTEKAQLVVVPTKSFKVVVLGSDGFEATYTATEVAGSGKSLRLNIEEGLGG